VATKRISDEPAYVLHRYDWSESSLILEVFTRQHGRIALVAKGAKRPTSAFRPVLLPLQPLHLAYGGDAEIKTLKSAEWQGGYTMPMGDALMSGYYVNELLLGLLARDDPHPRLFDHYAQTVHLVASEHGALLQAALRSFELLLLCELGLLPQLNVQTLTYAGLDSGSRYVLAPEAGLRSSGSEDKHALQGDQWMALQAALDATAPFSELLTLCANGMPGLKPQLRQMLHYHCGVSRLRTRQMMLDVQDL
jgi:DNA repair protein RecO (recombination protein O)